MTKKL